ncbi:MAG: DUF4998 domain-containing protein [Dysgonomonas sp.]
MYKYIRHILLPFVAIMALSTSCDGMYDTLNDYAGEIIYPAKFDTVVGYIGYNRVEIDLLKAGRIPASEIVMGKAKKTIVEYDNEKLVIDTLASWLNIGNLTSSKLYRFYIYTIDEFENKSVPQEVAIIPFTDSDKNSLVISSPKIMYSPTSAVVDWGSLSNLLYDYVDMSYKYVDKDGKEQKGEIEEGELPRLFVKNLEPRSTVNITVIHNVIPKIDGKKILDVLPVENVITLTMPSSDTPFSPAEETILETNGITTFTADGVKNITKLVYPLTTSSLQDLFYFPSLKELDLTGGTLFSITSQTYSGNDKTNTVGGGQWQPFIRKSEAITVANTQALKDLLEADMLEKITYIPHSLGLDDLLAPYVEKGIVKFVSMPNEAPVPNNYIVNGTVATNSFKIAVEYPALTPPAGAGPETYKIEMQAGNGTFIIALPKEYRFNSEEYRYLKLDVYASPKSVLEAGTYAPYKRLWFRLRTFIWNVENSNFGSEEYNVNKELHTIPNTNLESSWTSLKVDLSEMNSRHSRVIAINFGGEPGGTFAPASPIVYHISNMRFSKD